MDPTEQVAFDDAKGLFEAYSIATEGFIRSIPLSSGGYSYPTETSQTDALALAGIFTCLWRVIGNKTGFSQFYSQKPKAFSQICRIVTPNSDGHVTHARYYSDGNVVPVIAGDESTIYDVCRTMRNGFGHFNYRYLNLSPRSYFQRMGLALPSQIVEPDKADNYRIFICDWRSGDPLQFMKSQSDTRIVETHFPHFRYHLYEFLAEVFTDGVRPYKDILKSGQLGVMGATATGPKLPTGATGPGPPGK